MIEFNDLWRGHPINESVTTPCIAPHNLTNLEGNQVLLGFPVFANQCAIRMGVALRRAGVQPSQLSGISHCSVHPRDEMHFINANQLANGIARASIAGIGPTEKFKGPDAAQFYPKIFGRTGIIYIQDYWRRSSDGDRPGPAAGASFPADPAELATTFRWDCLPCRSAWKNAPRCVRTR